MYFDSHAHYGGSKYKDDRDELLDRLLPEAGVSYVLNVGSHMGDSRSNIELVAKYDYIYATVGVHPHYAKDITDEDIGTLADLTLEPKVVGIGEIGLDYFHNFSPKDVQQIRFEQQLQLALELDLPAVIHCRDSEEDVMAILRNSRAGETIGGVLHCFSGNVASAQKYLELGWHLGISGVVTYKNAGTLRDVVAHTPKERLLIETDCPYLAPEPHRGTRNDSRNLYHITEKIAEIWNMPHSEVAKITTDNAKKLFKIIR